jgi:hypothetical protein
MVVAKGGEGWRGGAEVPSHRVSEFWRSYTQLRTEYTIPDHKLEIC